MQVPPPDAQSRADGASCAICLQKLRTGARYEYLLHCTHSFHKTCMHRLVASGGGGCPLCRTGLSGLTEARTGAAAHFCNQCKRIRGGGPTQCSGCANTLWLCKGCKPTCAVCRAPVCDVCARQCHECEGNVCADDLLTCVCGNECCTMHATRCGAEGCENSMCAEVDCNYQCITCERMVCTDCSTVCETCGGTVCTGCLTACDGCGGIYCGSCPDNCEPCTDDP